MQVTSKEQTLKVLSMTRFHFIAGLPRAGAGLLTRLLMQNPGVQATSDSPAAALFAQTAQGLRDHGNALGALEGGAGIAMLRATLDAVHHARPMEAVVFDENPAWLGQTAELARVVPLARFILMVRDPAAIAAGMAQEQGHALSPEALMAPTGALGGPMAAIHDALQGPEAERVLLVDRDRLLQDPERVMAALYSFTRAPAFTHDTDHLPAPGAAEMPVLRRRAIPPLAGLGQRRRADSATPVWRRLSASGATMLLPEAG